MSTVSTCIVCKNLEMKGNGVDLFMCRYQMSTLSNCKVCTNHKKGIGKRELVYV